MPKQIAIENVHVEIHGNRYAAGFNYDGARWHVWFNPVTLEIDGVLYKNPLVEPHAPGYFDTRRLNPLSRPNAALLGEMWGQVKAGDMIAKARAKKEEDERLAQAAVDETNAMERIRGHGPQLLAALKNMVPQAERAIKDAGGCDHSVGICMCAEIAEIEQAKQVIVLATQERIAEPSPAPGSNALEG